MKRQNHPLRVVIGAGETNYDGWVTTDLPVFDALDPSGWRRIFPAGKVDRILAEHVIEHWTESQFQSFLRTVRRFFSSQGFVRIAVPDGFHPDENYIDAVRPGGTGPGASDHKVLYNYLSLKSLLAKEGYECNLLEYFDETGSFNSLAWRADDGFILRSLTNDPRNREKAMSYTSLIVDVWPKGLR